MSLKNLAQKAQKIDVRKLALQIAQLNVELINNRVRGQLIVGENSSGGKVGTYKSSWYAAFKQRIGSIAPSGVVDLKLSGNLHKGLKTAISPTNYDTDSDVEYSEYQKKRYGDKIYELQKENSEDIKFKNSVDTIRAYKKLLGI